MISALEGCDALLEEMYRSIASGWTRMEVLIPRAEYAAASRLYGLRHRSLGFVETLGCARVLPQKVLRLYPLPSRELSAGATMYEDLEVLPLERRDPSRPYVIVNMASYFDGKTAIDGRSSRKVFALRQRHRSAEHAHLSLQGRRRDGGCRYVTRREAIFGPRRILLGREAAVGGGGDRDWRRAAGERPRKARRGPEGSGARPRRARR
jgi:hypothetical protein